MRAILALLILILPGLSRADTADATLPAGDQRAIRELQDRAYGSPSLAMDAPRPEGLLALAELGAAASTPEGEKGLQADDYAALLALLQRYRDDLLKMGMDSSELQAQLAVLEARTAQLEERLKALHPKDGLKIFGRFYSVFDDLHVLGNGYIPQNPLPPGIAGPPSPASLGKPADVGVRTQEGVVHTELKLEGTRGPASAYAQMDLVYPWGEIYGDIGFRRAMVEYRTPVTLQVGDLDSSLTPLTLWRNDEVQPFEPSVFAERRQRMEDDLLLKPNQWTITGIRLSTDPLLFNAVTLHVQSLTGMVGTASNAGLPAFADEVIYQQAVTLTAPSYQYLAERYNTYLEGWQVSVPMLDNDVSLSYEGNVFFDVNATGGPTLAGSPDYVPMNEFVHSLGLGIKGAGFHFDAEAAYSNYQHPWITSTAQAVAGPLTGTALTADAGWNGDSGRLRLFGRYVSSGFHAAGAQGRTVDYNYQYLGPFLTDNSQVGPTGAYGLMGPSGIPLSNASRLNDVLIPPGTYIYGSAQPGGVWNHELAYGPGEEIDPYGVATQNRSGGGVEADWKVFRGVFKPMASAEVFKELDPVTNSAGAVLDPFSMSRYRAGLEMDFEPWLKWPLRLGYGYTMTDSQNGQQAANGLNWELTTELIDASFQINAGKPIGIQGGYRQLQAGGQDETFVLPGAPAGTQGTPQPGGEIWDILGLGVWWRPTETVSFDVVTTMATTTIPQDSLTVAKISSGNLHTDQTVARVTLEF